MAVEQTLILIKPDALVKSLTGNILTQLSVLDLQIVGAKIVKVNKELAEEHYRHLKEKEFFDELIKYIMGHYHAKRVLAFVYEGEDAVKIGQILNADVLITGNLFGKDDSFELFLRLVRVETGEILSVTRSVIDGELGIR